MTLSGEFFRYQGGALVGAKDLLDEVKLAAADSWLVENGRVRSLDAHYERFSEWVEAKAPELAADLPKFFELVTAALPESGRWFPRIELHLEAAELAGPGLYLRLREAPEQLGPIRLVSHTEPDPRAEPRVKGPDLSLCMQLRRKAQMHSADETVLLSPEGFVVEGALTALVWWRDDVLCGTDDEIPWLHSITRDEVFAVAHQLGLETRVEKATVDSLQGCEIWALSSLQGIRPVIEWLNADGSQAIEIAAPKHFESFSKRLRMLAAAIN